MTTDTLQCSETRAADAARRINLTQKLCFVAPVAAVQVGIYWLLNHFPLLKSRELPLTWIDRATPFWLWTIWGYFALIAMAPGLPLLVREKRAFHRLLRAYFIAMGTAWLFFLIFPTHYPRPPRPTDDSRSNMAYRSLLEFDSPECCFPSSHVIVPLLACAALRKDKSLGAWWPLVATSVVVCCLSILTTKQHYLWDLIGGACSAGLGWLASGWRPFVNAR
jgi:hypothetical protein